MLVRVQGRVEALDDREELPDDKRTDEVVKDTSKDGDGNVLMNEECLKGETVGLDVEFKRDRST